MQVKIKTPIVGSGQCLVRNQVYDLSERQAKELIDVGFAIACDASIESAIPAKKRDTATRKPSELR